MTRIHSILVLLFLLIFTETAMAQAELKFNFTYPVPQQQYAEIVLSDQVIFSNYAWGAPSSFGILNDSNVRRDLELLDEQFEEISRIRKDFSNQISKLKKEIKQNPDRAKDLSISIKKIRDKQKDEIKNVLLPHQQERLKQVQNQMQLENLGTSTALQQGEFAKELKITPEQKKELAELQKDLQKEIQEKLKQLKDKAKKKMLESLTPEQRLKFNQMTGDEFKRKKK